MSELSIPNSVAGPTAGPLGSPPWYRRPATKWVGIPLLVLAVFGIWHCGRAVTADVALAESAVGQFHEDFNANGFERIYMGATNEFRKDISKSDWIALLSAVQRKLGNVVHSQRETQWSVNSDSGGTFVRISYQTDFTSSRGQERFVWKIENQQARLFNYTVNSRDLILK